jgi:hypothetical protein
VHADHEYPTFEQILKQFRKQTTLRTPVNVSEVKDLTEDKQNNRKIFKEEDKEYVDAWVVYHQLNATLRLAHPNCNLSRKKKANQREGQPPRKKRKIEIQTADEPLYNNFL